MTALILAKKGEKPGYALVCGAGCKYREKSSSRKKKCVHLGPQLAEDGKSCETFQRKNGG